MKKEFKLFLFLFSIILLLIHAFVISKEAQEYVNLQINFKVPMKIIKKWATDSKVDIFQLQQLMNKNIELWIENNLSAKLSCQKFSDKFEICTVNFNKEYFLSEEDSEYNNVSQSGKKQILYGTI